MVVAIQCEMKSDSYIVQSSILRFGIFAKYKAKIKGSLAQKQFAFAFGLDRIVMDCQRPDGKLVTLLKKVALQK